MTENFEDILHLKEMKNKRVVIYLINENEQIEQACTGSFAEVARKIWEAHQTFGNHCIWKDRKGETVPLDYHNAQYEAEYNFAQLFAENDYTKDY